MSTHPDALAETVSRLARRRRWYSTAEFHRQTGIARSTLDRVTGGHGARGDTLGNLEEQFGLPPGTLADVYAGHITVEEALHRDPEADIEVAADAVETRDLAEQLNDVRRELADIKNLMQQVLDERR